MASPSHCLSGEQVTSAAGCGTRKIARVDVLESMTAADPFWRRLEQGPVLSTAYQRFNLLAAWQQHVGARFLFARTTWQPLYHAIYAAYAGLVAESIIVDIDHWRHYFLILGVLWGLMAATSRQVAQSWAAGMPVRNAAAA